VPASGRTAWGWHRLTDDWAATIVADAGVCRGDLVLDIGAGDGVLTRALLAAGARVVAVELHPRRVHRLQTHFAGQRAVTVVRADARDLYLPRRPFRVVANPPFSVTGPLLRRLTAHGSRLVSADVVLQRAAARRYAQRAATRDHEVRVGRSVPRAAFRPPPHVDAAVLTIRRR